MLVNVHIHVHVVLAHPSRGLWNLSCSNVYFVPPPPPPPPPLTHHCGRFGYVEFSTGSQAKRALSSLNGLELEGRELRVDVAEARGSSGGGRGGGRGGGGRGRGRGGTLRGKTH